MEDAAARPHASALVRSRRARPGSPLADGRPNGTARLRLEQEVPPTRASRRRSRCRSRCESPCSAGTAGEKIAEKLILLDKPRDEAEFSTGGDKVVLSINRGFSAPVVVETERPAADLAFLSAHDDDPFARYEAMQQLMLDTLLAAIGSGRGGP
jgi:aminopeptidase N